MAIEVSIAEGNRGHELPVTIHQHPPTNSSGQPLIIPVREFFTRKDTGSNDMRAAGSLAAPVKYAIRAVAGFDIYVGTISAVIVDASATLKDFGALAPLTNGVLFEWSSDEAGTVVLHEGIKTNFQFMRLACGNPAFGSGASAFLANNMSGNSEGYMPVIDIEDIFSIKYGIRLRANTNDELSFTVRDDITLIDQFDCIGYGFRMAAE